MLTRNTKVENGVKALFRILFSVQKQQQQQHGNGTKMTQQNEWQQFSVCSVSQSVWWHKYEANWMTKKMRRQTKKGGFAVLRRIEKWIAWNAVNMACVGVYALALIVSHCMSNERVVCTFGSIQSQVETRQDRHNTSIRRKCERERKEESSCSSSWDKNELRFCKRHGSLSSTTR